MKMIGYIGMLVPLLAIGYMSASAQAQRFAPGYCPTVAAHENFDKTKFFGNWIEVEKTPSIFDLMMRCLVVDYSDDQDNTVNVVVRGVSLAGLPLTVNGDGLLQDVHRSGFYSIRYGFGVPFQGTLTTIVDTDYEDYAVVYSCTNSLLSGVFHSEYIWVLSRSGKISNPTRQNIYEKLDKLSINRSGLTMSDRSTCPTNSSLIARESESNLAGQPQPIGAANQAAGLAGQSGSQAAGSATAVNGEQVSGSVASQPSAALEKASGEQAKSVVVPLLYDLPSPASSSSVGNSPSSSASQKAQKVGPLSPVENKIQLPLASASSTSAKQQAASVASPIVKPASSQASSSPANSIEKQQAVAQNKPNQSVSSSAVQQQQAQAAPSSQLAPSVQQSQQAQQSTLLNKIQQKP